MLAKVCWAVLLVMGVRVAKAQSGVQRFNYPGTNYPTKLTSINEDGVAVGWFSHLADGGKCDPAQFGGPCMTNDLEGDAHEIPFGFIYSDGKFTRLKGPIAGVGNNKPIWISNHGKILIRHGEGVNGPFTYMLYDLATGSVSNIGTIA